MTKSYNDIIRRVQQIGFILECYLDFIELQYMNDDFNWFDEFPVEYNDRVYIDRCKKFMKELKEYADITNLNFNNSLNNLLYNYLLNNIEDCNNFYNNVINDSYRLYVHYLDVRRLIGSIKDYWDISWYDVISSEDDQSDENSVIR